MAEQTYSEQLARHLHKAEECAAFARAAASQQPCDGEMPDRAAEWRAANWWDGLAELLRQAQANCERMEALETITTGESGEPR